MSGYEKMMLNLKRDTSFLHMNLFHAFFKVGAESLTLLLSFLSTDFLTFLSVFKAAMKKTLYS